MSDPIPIFVHNMERDRSAGLGEENGRLKQQLIQ